MQANSFGKETMVESIDMEMSSASDTNSTGNSVPLSETNYPIEEKETEKFNMSNDSNTLVSTATAAAKTDLETYLIFDGDCIDHSLKKDKTGIEEGRITSTVGRISPIGSSDIDSCHQKPTIDANGANHNAFQSQRIEPEGATPVPSKTSQRFDDALLENFFTESRQKQENIEKTIRSDIQRTESGDVMATVEGSMNDVVGYDEDTKKKPKEPPGTPAKHERKRSETADERERRINEAIHHQNESSLSNGRQFDEEALDLRKVIDEKKLDDEMLAKMEPSGSSISLNKLPTSDTLDKISDQGKHDEALLGEGIVIDKKKREDEISIEREPSGTSISSIKIPVDTLDKNSNQGKQPKELVQKEISAVEVEIVEQKYESPPRVVQRHNIDVDNNHNVQGNTHESSHQQSYNENIRQTPNSLSPAFFDDSDDIPIPLLPPLILPGTKPTYDSLLVQGQSQQVHMNYQQQFHQMPSILSQQQQQQPIFPIPNQVTTMPGGKRKIHLHLWEDVGSLLQPEKSSFLSFRRKSRILQKFPQQSTPISELDESNHNKSSVSKESDKDSNRWADRGSLTVSWYEGTSSLELQEHVQNSVIRKLGLRSTMKLLDFRVLDESSDPPEEIVLCPYIPNGSRLIVRFATTDGGDLTPPKYTRFSDYTSGPPDSPSAAPSPYPRSLDLNGLGLNANQLALLGTRLHSVQVPVAEGLDAKNRAKSQQKSGRKTKQPQYEKKSSKDGGEEEETNSKESNFEVASLHPEDQIQKSLREITGLLLRQREGRQLYAPRQEKRQVIFVLANYFVLFLSLIAISAEIQARAPGWHAAMEQQLKNVHDCSKDKESLFTCVENGDMAGLVASVILWVSRSAATKRIFLLGFGSPNKLWTAVYESLVTAICWGFSYMFIRRGMNPDNNRDFLRRYWKDAVYGSLAGFNAAFMKQVLKNLIPQEAIEDALQERQLKILSWLPSIG